MQPEQLKSLRKRLGLTQAKLASSLNVATNTVARWERGVMTIPDSAAVKLERMAEAGPPAFYPGRLRLLGPQLQGPTGQSWTHITGQF